MRKSFLLSDLLQSKRKKTVCGFPQAQGRTYTNKHCRKYQTLIQILINRSIERKCRERNLI